MCHSPSASLCNIKVQFPVTFFFFFFFFGRSSLAYIQIFHFMVRTSTFVYPRENEFLKVIASVLHSVCCSLGEVVINGSSHSVCSRQALPLLLPRWATSTSLTPSQEQANIRGYALPAGMRLEGGGWREVGKNNESQAGEATAR